MLSRTDTERVAALERDLENDIRDTRFHPYVQLHEFEVLLFSSNAGFETYFDAKFSRQTKGIINEFPNPEDINSAQETAPSNRLLSINRGYGKVLEGNLIALEVGIDAMLRRCPRFSRRVVSLIEVCL